jgi:hypothetical protein
VCLLAPAVLVSCFPDIAAESGQDDPDVCDRCVRVQRDNPVLSDDTPLDSEPWLESAERTDSTWAFRSFNLDAYINTTGGGLLNPTQTPGPLLRLWPSSAGSWVGVPPETSRV